jgi:hypothetical protein
LELKLGAADGLADDKVGVADGFVEGIADIDGFEDEHRGASSLIFLQIVVHVQSSQTGGSGLDAEGGGGGEESVGAEEREADSVKFPARESIATERNFMLLVSILLG